jgi:hypothetical protein
MWVDDPGLLECWWPHLLRGRTNGIVDCVHKTAGPLELFGLLPACHTKK